MSTTSNRRAVKRPAAEAVALPKPAEEREPRGARRKRETRARLLDAALRLMAEKGMEGVAINEITEAADVGFGSFYNHFESKEAIYAALVDSVFEEFADTMDRLASGLTDPAEVIAVAVRYTLLRARREPVWGQFLIRDGLSARVLQRGLGHRLLRDIERGIAAKRFTADDLLMSFASVGGTVLTAIAMMPLLDDPAAMKAEAARFRKLGFNVDNIGERTAATVLQALGLKRAEAEKIAYRPAVSKLE